MGRVQVLRLETASGEGPFAWSNHGYRAHDKFAQKHCRNTFFDIPSVNDDVPGFERGMLCGFRSLTQLRKWVRSKPGVRAMAAEGIRLSVYSLPAQDVRFGQEQVAYIPHRAELVEVRDVTAIH